MDPEKKFNYDNNSSYKKPILYYCKDVLNTLTKKKPGQTNKIQTFITKYLRPHPKKRGKENH